MKSISIFLIMTSIFIHAGETNWCQRYIDNVYKASEKMEVRIKYVDSHTMIKILAFKVLDAGIDAKHVCTKEGYKEIEPKIKRAEEILEKIKVISERSNTSHTKKSN